jgi:hypothetical protein
MSFRLFNHQLFQQNRPKADLPIELANVCFGGEERTQKGTPWATCFMSTRPNLHLPRGE